MSNNPYETARQIQMSDEPIQANWRRWSAFGFAVAFIPVAAIGVFGLYNESQYAATLPPDTVRCGNGAMGAMLIIFPISPIFGCSGAGVGFISALVYNAMQMVGDSPKTEEVN